VESGPVFIQGKKDITITVNIWGQIGSQLIKSLHQYAAITKAGWT